MLPYLIIIISSKGNFTISLMRRSSLKVSHYVAVASNRHKRPKYKSQARVYRTSEGLSLEVKINIIKSRPSDIRLAYLTYYLYNNKYTPVVLLDSGTRNSPVIVNEVS